ncbi:hypothetical protein SAMN05443253_105128 [Bacillus sp. OK048]|nr:hypothetical protein SAMN05443253_105128 [Bacillus sp. OK048]
MTEEHSKKRIGSLQEAWSDREDSENQFGSLQALQNKKAAVNKTAAQQFTYLSFLLQGFS